MPTALRLTARATTLLGLVALGACSLPALPETGVIQCGARTDPHRCPDNFQCDINGLCCSNRSNACVIPDGSSTPDDATIDTPAPPIDTPPLDTAPPPDTGPVDTAPPLDTTRACATGFTHACIPECRAGMPRCNSGEGCVMIPNGGEGCLPTCLTTPDCVSLNTATVQFTCRAFGANTLCAPDCRGTRPNFCGVGNCNLITGLCTL